MTDFTIEQLEVMQEKITPGERYLYEDDWDSLMVVNDDGRDMNFGDQLRVKVEAGHPEYDGESIVAIPKLIDALIAEKQAHQRLREEIEAQVSKWRFPSMPSDADDFAMGQAVGIQDAYFMITRILEGDNADQT